MALVPMGMNQFPTFRDKAMASVGMVDMKPGDILRYPYEEAEECSYLDEHGSSTLYPEGEATYEALNPLYPVQKTSTLNNNSLIVNPEKGFSRVAITVGKRTYVYKFKLTGNEEVDKEEMMKALVQISTSGLNALKEVSLEKVK